MDQFEKPKASTQGTDGPLEEVRGIVLRRLAGTDCQIYLFGSFARGDPSASSDIDIAIEHDRPLGEELDESRVPLVVNVVDLDFAPPALQDAVRREGILWKRG